MLTNIGDIENDVIVQGSINTTSAYFSDTILLNWIDKAHKWAAGYRKWPFTEGRVSTTFASLVTDEDGMRVGEYPEGWKSDSIRMLQVGGKRMKKKNFYKFRSFLEDNPSSTFRYFSDFGRRYYLNPNADVSGTIAAWGQFLPAKFDITDLTATTVFSLPEEEGNEAIVNEVLSFVEERKGNSQASLLKHQEAMAVLDKIWEKIQQEQSGYQDVEDDGMFNRIDVLNGAATSDINKENRFF